MSSVIGQAALGLFTFLQTQGPLGALYYMGFLVLWTLCCLPTTPLEIAAGYTFSPVLSIGASIVGKTAGSLIAFALGRQFAARVLARPAGAADDGGVTLAGRARALSLQLQSAVTARPVQTITMVRASPMPIAIKNYGLALLPAHVLPGRLFAVITLVVNMPYSIAWSLTGSSASSLQEALSGDARTGGAAVLLKLGALLALFGALSVFARKCRAELARCSPTDLMGDAKPKIS
ncbi:hypothetical protein T492DRAFT_1092304 [Pavlovales sp. CCMP2436]|nr:hypothetical protein T492DRAFT_1092304 [Pavlovales sp. CCMP2436]|mmetsp:Transcript_44652/g.110714  ORF Transcript_44652/g.110714 Transcript_44652/m.110714 type:complete len:234 (-) Transcript_44652:266-967(-)